MNIFRTIRMRFTIIYFILVLSSLALIGVFILRSFKDYSLRTVRETMNDMGYVVTAELSKIKKPYDAPAVIRKIVDQQFEFGGQAEVFVLNAQTLEMMAATASYVELENLDETLLNKALAGEEAERDTIYDTFAVKDRVYLSNSGKLIVYLRYDLRNHLALIEHIKLIIARSIAIAIVATSFISLLLSKSITDPINSLTKQAKLLTEGDFDQVVDVVTDDEIGEFSKTFNYLVSEINQRMERLTEEKNKVETITNNIDEGLVAVTNNGNIIHSNQKAQDLMGDLVPDEILAFYGGGKDGDPAGIKDGVIERGGRYLQLNFAEFTEQNERGIIVAIQDITKQQQIEHMRREFIADVSHELKTPLTSVISYAETIRDSEGLDEETRAKFLDVIVSESERMTRLVKDLLYLSAIDSAQQYLRYSEANVKTILNRCIMHLALQANHKKQDIIFQNAEEVIATVDQDQIQQLVINILSNAIKYSPDGSAIEVSLATEESDFTIEIADCGPGISEEDLKHIFDRFYRVDKARSRAMGGTGLGLAIAKGIVELHGGQIEARSQLGKGTTVYIRIPIHPPGRMEELRFQRV